MAGNASARLAQEHAAQPVTLALKRLHLLENGVAGRRQHPADDDVSDLPACVAADNRDRPRGAHPRGR